MSCSNTENMVDRSELEEVQEALTLREETVSDLNSTINDLDERLTIIEEENQVMDDLLNEKETIINNQNQEIEALKSELNSVNNQQQSQNSLLSQAIHVLNLLENQDATGLNDVVHPTRGVRFSPYQYVDTNNHIVFYKNNTVPSMFTNTTVYIWGEYDGTGDDIAGDALSYYNEFVYDEDYLNADIIGQNTIVSSGNMINNIETVYPNDEYVEFYFPEFDPQYSGMDWKSLTLVFENDNGTYYLVGIVHGQWTI